MKVYTGHDILAALCKAENKFGIYISFDYDDDWGEILKAAPYLEDLEDRSQILCDCHAYLIFDSEEDMRITYHETVGNDGPTLLNKYDGPARVYALTCGPDGFLTENA